jgi:hypothetical protein
VGRCDPLRECEAGIAYSPGQRAKLCRQRREPQ